MQSPIRPLALAVVVLAQTVWLPTDLSAQAGSPVPGFQSGTFSTQPSDLAIDDAGRILVVGDFSAYGGVLSRRMGRILADGRLDPTFVIPGNIEAYRLGPGLIPLGGGSFLVSENSSTTTQMRTLKVLPNGTLDTALWDRDFPWSFVFLESGKLLHDTGGLGVWNVDLSNDTTYVSPLPSEVSVSEIAKRRDGGVVVVAQEGSTRTFYFLSPDAREITSKREIVLGPSGGTPQFIHSMALQSDDKLLLLVKNGDQISLHRFLADGTYDETFQATLPYVTSHTLALCVQSDDRILLGGRFAPRVLQAAVFPILRLMPDGTPDPTFDLFAESQITNWSSYEVPRMALDSDGNLVAILKAYTAPSGGLMSYWIIGSSQPSPRLIRLRADGPQPPHRPLEASADSVSPSLTKLSWKPVAGADDYRIEKEVADQWITIGQSDVSTYDDRQVDGITNSRYRIIARNSAGDSLSSEPAQVFRLFGFPGKITVRADSPTRTTLEWPDVDGEWSYEVYRLDGLMNTYLTPLPDSLLQGGATKLATLSRNATSFSDETAAPRAVYSYVVAARNLAGTAWGGYAIVEMPSDLPPVLPRQPEISPAAGQSITLTWRDATSEDEYLLEWRPAGLESWRTLAVLPANTTTFTSAGGLPAGQRFEFRLTASNSFGGTSSPTLPVSAVVPDASWRPAGEVLPGTATPRNLTYLLDVKKTQDGGYLVYTGNFPNEYNRPDYLPSIQRLDPSGRSLPFREYFLSRTARTAFLPLLDGRVLAAPGSSDALSCFNADGSSSPFEMALSFHTPRFDGPIRQLFQLRDESILVFGDFESVDDSATIDGDLYYLRDSPIPPAGSVRINLYRREPPALSAGLVRINREGRVLQTFQPEGLPDALANAKWVLEQPDGKLVIGLGNTTVIRLDQQGAFDLSFGDGGVVIADYTIAAAALQPDGKILLGGAFTSLGHLPPNSASGLIRLLSDGKPDPTWQAGSAAYQTRLYGFAPGSVSNILVDSSGRILIAGSFSRFDTRPADGLVRLTSDGCLDPGFQRPPEIKSNDVSRMFQGAGGDYFLFGRGFWRVSSEPMIDVEVDPPATSLALSTSSVRFQLPSTNNPDASVEKWSAENTSWVEVGRTAGGSSAIVEGLTPGRWETFRIRRETAEGPVYSETFRSRSHSPFESWKVARGLPLDGPSATSTIPPLVAYAFATDPDAPDSKKLPIVEGTESGRAGVRFRRERPELRYSVEVSEDLISWGPASRDLQTSLIDGLTSVSVSTTEGAPLFFRIRVAEPSSY